MKNKKIAAVGIGILMILSGCEESFLNDVPETTEDLTIAELEVGDLKSLESVNEDVDAVICVANMRGTYTPRIPISHEMFGAEFPSCATVTVDQDSFPKTITIEYAEDCATRNGMSKSGTIIITQTDSINTPGATYAVQYIDLSVGRKLVNGEASFTFEGENEAGNIVVSWVDAKTVVLNDSVEIYRSGSYSKEWLSGYETREMKDDIYMISGEGIININDNYEFERFISEPLLIDRSCRFILSGVIEITRNDELLIIDYGDGECDNIATATKDGVTEEIELISEKFQEGFQRHNRNMNKRKGWW